MIPNRWRPKNARRCAPVIGTRSDRCATSSSDGFGIWFNIQTQISNGKMNSAPVKTGIQNSDTPQSCISVCPIDFTTPEEIIMLAERPAASASVTRRPSRKARTKPNTMPNGSPLKNNHAKFQGGGVAANNKSAVSAIPISTRIPTARRDAGISETTLMPTNLESM